MQTLAPTLLLALAACSGPWSTSSDTTGTVDTHMTVDTSDTDDTSDTGDTGDTGDTSDPQDTQDTSTTPPVDADSDGYTSDVDCDEEDPEVHPGATETCDGIDNDCDPETPEKNIVSLPDGTTTTTIQDAIDAATAGDILSICPGTYTEHLVIEQALTLVGTQGAEQTILDANDPSPRASTVEVRSSELVRLEGLTITGGNGTMKDGEFWGGGINAEQSAGLEVYDCIVTGNRAEYGAGMLGTGLYPAEDLIVRTVFEDNLANWYGGGFLLFHATLEGVEVRDNEAVYGGGGAVWYWGVTTDNATLLESNHAVIGGGGLYLYDLGTWIGSQILDNTATELGGGVLIANNGKIRDATVARNDSPGSGGGIAVDGGEAFGLLNIDLADNTAASGAGLTTIDASGGLDTVVFSGNAAGKIGGGLYLTGKTVITASATTFSGSTPDDMTLYDGSSSINTYEVAKTADFTCDSSALTCTWK